MTSETIGATPDIDNESLGTRQEENNSSSESLSVGPDPVVQKETTELSNEVVQTQFDKKLEDLTNYSETLKNLRPHFNQYIEEKHGDLIEVLSNDEKNLVEIALWNEVMKINIDDRFGGVADSLVSNFTEIFSSEKGAANQEQANQAGNVIDETIKEVTEKFDEVLEEPIVRIKEFKSREGSPIFKTPGEVYGVIEGNDEKSNVEFLKILQENQDTFLEQFEDKGGVTQDGRKLIGYINKLGPLKNEIEGIFENLFKIPFIGIFFMSKLGTDFLAELREGYNPEEDLWDSLTSLLNKEIDPLKNATGELLSKWSPNDEEKQKSMNNIITQAKKANISTEDENFWSNVFSADENDTSYFSQLNKHLNNGIEKAENANEYFTEKFTTFEFDKNYKLETSD